MTANKGCVLVVDDDPEIVNFLGTLLELEGITTQLATSAAQAERILASPAAREIKLVLLDIAMPDRNGLDLCRAMHEDPRLRELPVFVVSARPGRDVIERAREAGAKQFIRKPFENAELLALIRDQLGI